MKTFRLLLISFLITNCSSTNIDFQDNIYWVHSAKVACTGVGQMTCLQIQKGNTVDINKGWNLFYSQIVGFEYQPGFIYKLSIKEETVANPPADGSSKRFTLIEVLEKKQDKRYSIHDIYILTHIGGKEIDLSQIEKQPTLEINISKMQLSGNNGCNNFSGAINKIDQNKITFGAIRETKMMCKNMEVPTLFTKGMSLTTSFKKDNQGLHFIDTTSKTVLSFKKID